MKSCVFLDSSTVLDRVASVLYKRTWEGNQEVIKVSGINNVYSHVIRGEEDVFTMWRKLEEACWTEGPEV